MIMKEIKFYLSFISDAAVKWKLLVILKYFKQVFCSALHGNWSLSGNKQK